MENRIVFSAEIFSVNFLSYFEEKTQITNVRRQYAHENVSWIVRNVIKYKGHVLTSEN
jgi:hypothetical protein